MKDSLQLATTIGDLVTTLLNSETQLQTRLRACDHPGLSAWGRQVLAHTLQSSEQVSESLETLAVELDTTAAGHVTYSTEPFLRRIQLRSESIQRSTQVRCEDDFESAAAILRCTKLRVANLSLLRLALAAQGNQTVVQCVNQLVEDAYFSAERLREFAKKRLMTGGTVGDNTPSLTCQTCQHWAGNGHADEPSKAACMHPNLSGVRLQVSALSGCDRHESSD